MEKLVFADSTAKVSRRLKRFYFHKLKRNSAERNRSAISSRAARLVNGYGWNRLRSEASYQSTDMSCCTEETPIIGDRYDLFPVSPERLATDFNSELPESCVWSYLTNNDELGFFQDYKLFVDDSRARPCSEQSPDTPPPPLKLRRLRKTRDPAQPDVWTMVNPSRGEVEHPVEERSPPAVEEHSVSTAGLKEEDIRLGRISLRRYCKRLLCLSRMEHESVEEVSRLDRLVGEQLPSAEISLSFRALAKSHMDVERMLEDCHNRLDEAMRSTLYSGDGRFLDMGLRERSSDETQTERRSVRELQRLYSEHFKQQTG